MEKPGSVLKTLNVFERINSREHKDFVKSHNDCVLCGTRLELDHLPLAEGPYIKEVAHCPECEIRTRAKIYTLH